MCLLSHMLPLYLYSLATAFVVIPYCILYNCLHGLFQPHLTIPDKNLVFVLCSSCISSMPFLLWCSWCFHSSLHDLFGVRLVHQSCRVLLWPLQPLNGYLDCSWSCSSFGQVPSFYFLASIHKRNRTLMLGMFVSISNSKLMYIFSKCRKQICVR